MPGQKGESGRLKPKERATPAPNAGRKTLFFANPESGGRHKPSGDGENLYHRFYTTGPDVTHLRPPEPTQDDE